MLRSTTFLFVAALTGTLSAQQLTLDWATPVVPQNQRVKVLANGDVVAFGTATDAAYLQRFNAAGVVLWTRTFEAPALHALDMDLDATDNIYLYMGFENGQLDVDPGPNVTLLDAGQVFAKLNSNGAFQWGFALEEPGSLSEDYGGISVDAAGNLYVCGDLRTGTYDFDPTAGTYDLTVEASSRGSYMARYLTNGTLAWAQVMGWPEASSYSRDISVMPDGSSFYIVRRLHNGGGSTSQIDVDPGPNVFNIVTNEMSLLRYSSTMAFMAHTYINFNNLRTVADDSGALYLLGYDVNGAEAVKYTTTGTTVNTVYYTQLPDFNNLRVGGVVADGQGGCIGMYNLNCVTSTVRFYRMLPGGTIDYNVWLDSGTDCTMPGGRGFDARGDVLYVGTYNQNYTIDFDPGPGTLTLPLGDDDGVVAKYTLCRTAPTAPTGITTSAPLCTGVPMIFSTEPVAGASTYTWFLPPSWSITAGEGTSSITVWTGLPSTDAVAVSAANLCGSSNPVTEMVTVAQTPFVDLGPDLTVCVGTDVLLDATMNGATYLWQPGGETTPTITVSPTALTTYSVEVTQSGCTATDVTVITVDPCMGVAEAGRSAVRLWPVPVRAGEALRLEGIDATDVVGVFGADGRAWPVRINTQHVVLQLETAQLVAGSYVVRTTGGAFRFSVVE